MATEIERKWIPDQTPEPDRLGTGTPLRQGYVAIDGDVTVRVRISPERAWLTIKGGGDVLERVEVEVPVDLEEAEDLWRHTGDRRLEKIRHRLAVEQLTAEVDVFAGSLDGLCLVEVEFPSIEAAEAFTAPGWFGREVTGQPEWSNASLARYGRPTE